MGEFSIALVILPLVLFYVAMVIPQKKKDKALADMREDLQVGDHIITIGGIIGRVINIRDDAITIETGSEKTRIRMMKSSISQKETPQEAKDH